MLTQSCPAVSPSGHLSAWLLVVSVGALLHLLRNSFCVSVPKPLLQADLTVPVQSLSGWWASPVWVPLRMGGISVQVTLRIAGHLQCSPSSGIRLAAPCSCQAFHPPQSCVSFCLPLERPRQGASEAAV